MFFPNEYCNFYLRFVLLSISLFVVFVISLLVFAISLSVDSISLFVVFHFSLWCFYHYAFVLKLSIQYDLVCATIPVLLPFLWFPHSLSMMFCFFNVFPSRAFFVSNSISLLDLLSFLVTCEVLYCNSLVTRNYNNFCHALTNSISQSRIYWKKDQIPVLYLLRKWQWQLVEQKNNAFSLY